MSRKYKFHNPEGYYFVTFAVRHWVDVFTRPLYKDILVRNLRYCCKHKGLQLAAWCIMTNHIHLVMRASDGILPQDVLRDYKRFTSKAIVRAIRDNPRESRKEWMLNLFWNEEKQSFRFWRGDNQPIELWSNTVIDQKINYIHNNPVKEQIVSSAMDYVYSSARSFAGKKGLIDLEPL